MSGARGPRWPFAVTVVGVLVLLAGAGWLVWVWAQQGSSVADPLASVLGFVLAVGGAVVAVLGWMVRRRREAGRPATAEQEEQAAASLAGMVGEQWAREAQARALGDPEPMPVRWRLASPVLMDHPTVINPDTDLVFAESSARIEAFTAAFRALPRRRLVIIGGSGVGKTTLAVQLLRELLAHPEPGEPVPVLFSLTNWDPDSHPRVQDWLATELNESYPALRAIDADAAAALAGRGRILPFLDGFDEVSPVRRAGIIAALNASLNDGGVVLTSRRPEYRAARSTAGLPRPATCSGARPRIPRWPGYVITRCITYCRGGSSYRQYDLRAWVLLPEASGARARPDDHAQRHAARAAVQLGLHS